MWLRCTQRIFDGSHGGRCTASVAAMRRPSPAISSSPATTTGVTAPFSTMRRCSTMMRSSIFVWVQTIMLDTHGARDHRLHVPAKCDGGQFAGAEPALALQRSGAHDRVPDEPGASGGAPA